MLDTWAAWCNTCLSHYIDAERRSLFFSLFSLCAKLQSYAVQVNYINAHATSTLVGDIAEIKAVKSAFPDTKHLKVNGTKSMIGHCLGAAGGMEAIATLKAIETGWVHPTLNQVGASAL